MGEHIVVDGETLAVVASKYGVRRWEPIWDANPRLHAKRHPLQLIPGERIHIPEKREEPKRYGQTNQTHRFELKRDQFFLRVALQHPSGKPLANIDCVVTGVEYRRELKTDGDGVLEIPIEGGVRAARIDAKIPMIQSHPGLSEEQKLVDYRVELRIRWLQPETTDAGVKSRLDNLGYPFDGAVQEGKDGKAVLAPSAWIVLQEFQCDHGVARTFDVDDATRGALVDKKGHRS